MRLSQSSFSRGIWFACAAVASATMVLTSLQQAFTWCARPHASVVGPVPDARGRERGTSRRRERADIPRENIRSRRLSHNVRQRARVVNSCECCSSLLSQLPTTSAAAPDHMAAADLQACSGLNCSQPAKLKCPTCKKLGLRDAPFCSQDCFKANWPVHKLLHLGTSSKQASTHAPRSSLLVSRC